MRRKKGRTPTRPDLPDYLEANLDMEYMKQSVQDIKYISDELGSEIEKQNDLLRSMSRKYERSLDLVSKLNTRMKEIWKMAQSSPMAKTVTFVFSVIVFLFIYAKLFR